MPAWWVAGFADLVLGWLVLCIVACSVFELFCGFARCVRNAGFLLWFTDVVHWCSRFVFVC